MTMEQRLDLQTVADAFDIWRQTRTKKSKIPAHLIAQAVQLKKRYPYSAIAKALRMSGAQLKAKFAEPQKIDFVSLSPPPPISPPEDSTIQCELHRTDGAYLKMGLNTTQIQNFLKVFLCCK
jgi:hypothetical protein